MKSKPLSKNTKIIVTAEFRYRNANVDVILQLAAKLQRGEKFASIAKIERS